MNKPLIFIIFTILFGCFVQSQVVKIPRPNVALLPVDTTKPADNLILATQNAEIYFGNIQINIENG